MNVYQGQVQWRPANDTEHAQIGQHAVVVWFLDRKGNPRKYPYSLSVV